MTQELSYLHQEAPFLDSGASPARPPPPPSSGGESGAYAPPLLIGVPLSSQTGKSQSHRQFVMTAALRDGALESSGELRRAEESSGELWIAFG
eukprot:9024189-Alexandrium_andersonii.AAC.1